MPGFLREHFPADVDFSNKYIHNKLKIGLGFSYLALLLSERFIFGVGFIIQIFYFLSPYMLIYFSNIKSLSMRILLIQSNYVRNFEG